MDSFLSSIQQKAQQGLTQAQAALDKKGYDFKIPTSLGAGSQTSQGQQAPDQHGSPAGRRPSATHPDAKAGKGFFVENITHQLRTLHNQYAPSGPPDVQKLQVLITNAKGVSLDYQGVGRDTKALSKDFYLWGQSEEEDIKDVTDRLAYVHFTDGTLATTLSEKLDESRARFKKLREALAAIAPRRAQRAMIEADIKKAQANPTRVQELHQTLQKHIADDQPLERELGELKRLAIRDSELAKWDAIKEYAEKLLLVAEAGKLVVQQLPTTAPTSTNPYNGHKATASTRTALQNAIDHYQPGPPLLPGGSDPFDTRSFGESHASELSRVSSFSSPVDPTPAATQASVQTNPSGEAPGAGVGGFAPPQPIHQASVPTSSGPVNPALLNNSPAPIPAATISSTAIPANVEAPAAVTSPLAASEEQVGGGTAPIAPTVAETGIPVAAGAGGPGPASGSLSRDVPPPSIDAPPYDSSGAGVGGFKSDVGALSAEDEKKRLEREEREKLLAAGGASVPAQQPAYESAEDEKKRLEREEREKILRGESTSAEPPKPSGTPPPYS